MFKKNRHVPFINFQSQHTNNIDYRMLEALIMILDLKWDGVTVFILYDLFPGIKEANIYNINYNPDHNIMVKLLK